MKPGLDLIKILAGAILFLALSVSLTSAQGNDAAYAAGQVVVKFNNLAGWHVFNFESTADLASVVESYNQDPRVEVAELNYTFEQAQFPNDPNYEQQHYIQLVSARPAWSRELLYKQLNEIDSGATIAFLDTGIDTDHPDLRNQLWVNTGEIPNNGVDDDRNGFIDDYNGWDFVNGNSDVTPRITSGYTVDAIQHGTVMASIAAAEPHNGEGITGISWDAKIMPLKVLNNQGLGSSFDVKEAIDYAVANGADIINMSFFGLGYNQFLFEAIENAYNAGVVVVAAAGNTDPSSDGNDLNDQKSYPVCYDSPDGTNYVIGVAALDDIGRKSIFSSYGSDCVDVSAPGEGFFTATLYNTSVGFNTYYGGPFSGTSVATPLVSGGAAVVKSMRPDLTAADVIDLLSNASDSLTNIDRVYAKDLGSGRFNLLKAVLLSETYTATAPPAEPTDKYYVLGLGFRSVPQVKILDANLNLVSSFFPYASNFNGAINVATGDVNSDGEPEIITAAGSGGAPQVRIFDRFGNALGQFFAYNQYFRGGVNIAVGDVDRDGKLEIITGAGPGGGPHVRVFDYQGNLEDEFFAYAPGFRGGVSVAVGDLNGDRVDEIITGAGPGGGPHVRVFNKSGVISSQFFAYNENFRGGVNVAVGSLTQPSIDLIAVVPASNAQPFVKLFNPNGGIVSQFLVFGGTYNLGLQVSIFDYNNDGRGEVVASQGTSGSAEIQVYNLTGNRLGSFNGHDLASYRGGVRTTELNY